MGVFNFENSTNDNGTVTIPPSGYELSLKKSQIEKDVINTVIIWKKPRVTNGNKNENEGESQEFNLIIYL